MASIKFGSTYEANLSTPFITCTLEVIDVGFESCNNLLLQVVTVVIIFSRYLSKYLGTLPNHGFPNAPHLKFEPIQLPHKQTFILLHGRGSTGDTFGPVLLETPIGPPKQHTPPATTQPTSTLRTLFPHARFVFPTAARRRATIYRRAYTHQWFNNWKLDPPATGTARPANRRSARNHPLPP